VSAPRLFPAIDILGGKAVRLTRGSFDERTVYDEDPVDAARRWLDGGAEDLHVVDLEGARSGAPAALAELAAIAELGAPVQYGGGVRSIDSLSAALDAGALRVVVGTAAFTDQALLDQAIARFAQRVAVAVDLRGGKVATSGWLEQVDLTGPEAVRQMRERGVERFVYTNVDRDGTLEGVDPADVRSASEAAGDARFIYSGGVGSLADLESIAAADVANLEGVIVGKALYEGRFSVAQAKHALAPAKETA
jgi:phosphoribosylformimino-5-aminoimidazole carboxamide ribotide isomerase